MGGQRFMASQHHRCFNAIGSDQPDSLPSGFVMDKALIELAESYLKPIISTNKVHKVKPERPMTQFVIAPANDLNQLLCQPRFGRVSGTGNPQQGPNRSPRLHNLCGQSVHGVDEVDALVRPVTH
jgi:hypothetical protein